MTNQNLKKIKPRDSTRLTPDFWFRFPIPKTHKISHGLTRMYTLVRSFLSTGQADMKKFFELTTIKDGWEGNP